MSRFRDRTEDFKDSVRKSAISDGYTEAKVASTMASFIIHKPKERSPFTRAALKTLESIKELDQFMMKHRKDYVDMHRTTEHEKDSIEQEITAFIKACKEQIDVLKNSIRNEEANSKGWLGLAADNFNADTIAHKHGVVLILSEKLHSVTAQFDQLRATRFQDIINRAMPRRKPKRITKEASPVNATLANPEPVEPDEIQAQPRRLQQQQLLDDETQALQVELSNLLDGARQTETKMVEMSALNHLMATHVLQQAQQIEVLYDQAVEATKNVELGNKELSQAIQLKSHHPVSNKPHTSNDDKNLKAINASVGRLVWVRLRNGSWWPGQTLLHEEVPESPLLSPKLGTPIKLLGRDDVGIDWYVLEKSKSVKAFRCGEYDAHIEKAKASAAAARASSKKTVKCTRRENAIISALEIENAHLAKEDHPDNNLCSEEEDDEVTESEDRGEAEDELELLQSSMSSQEMVKVEPKRRRTPNDSEEDGTEGNKRMRGLEDIGKEHVGATVLHRQEMGSICDVNLSNGYIVSNGYKACSPLSLKRKRSQVTNGSECSKRKNRSRQLTKVLECTAMVCVPGTSDQLVTSGLEPVESMKSVSVVINNNSDSTGVSCENAPENVVGDSHNNKAKDSETSSVSVSAEDAVQLYDVPLTEGEAKHSAGFPAACTISSSRAALVSALTRRCSHDVSVKKEARNGSAFANPPDTQLVIWNSNGIEKSTSKWKLKGKRNSRQRSKKQEARSGVYSEEANNNRPLLLPALFEVKIEVRASCNKPRVPLVSRMSKLNGKAIVGHPVSVEALEESYYNGMVMSQAVVKAKSLSKKKSNKRKTTGPFGKSSKSKKKSSSLSVKTRRLSTLTERSKKQTIEKLKETVVACIPLKVVFSRINQVLKGSARQTQHRALPSAVKT
uniref:PWWP domain-containing protein n=1 Tax=Brassica campestris TaxID=3711 RepID=M4DQY8_BRACM